MNKIARFILASSLATIGLVGCGGSGSSSNPAGVSTSTGLANLRFTIEENGQPSIGANAVLYTKQAALTLGLNNKKDGPEFGSIVRASVYTPKAEGIYTPVSNDGKGNLVFEVPQGNEYTLVADNKELKAVKTSVRYAEENPTQQVSLTPTGSVKGRVVDSKGQAFSDALVYINGTTFVAFTDDNGQFEITSVPINSQYSISAIGNGEGVRLVTPDQSFTIDSSLVCSLPDLTIDKENETAFGIEGKVTYVVSEAAVEDRVVLAIGNDAIYSAITKNDGSYYIPVSKKGYYRVLTVARCEPESQTVFLNDNTVANCQDLRVFPDGITTISGKVVLYKNDNMKYDLPSTGNFSLRLAFKNSNGYYYEGQAAFDSSALQIDDMGSSFAFSGVPAGEYTLAVVTNRNNPYISVNPISVIVKNDGTVTYSSMRDSEPINECKIYVKSSIPEYDVNLDIAEGKNFGFIIRVKDQLGTAKYLRTVLPNINNTSFYYRLKSTPNSQWIKVDGQELTDADQVDYISCAIDGGLLARGVEFSIREKWDFGSSLVGIGEYNCSFTEEERNVHTIGGMSIKTYSIDQEQEKAYLNSNGKILAWSSSVNANSKAYIIDSVTGGKTTVDLSDLDDPSSTGTTAFILAFDEEYTLCKEIANNKREVVLYKNEGGKCQLEKSILTNSTEITTEFPTYGSVVYVGGEKLVFLSGKDNDRNFKILVYNVTQGKEVTANYNSIREVDNGSVECAVVTANAKRSVMGIRSVMPTDVYTSTPYLQTFSFTDGGLNPNNISLDVATIVDFRAYGDDGFILEYSDSSDYRKVAIFDSSLNIKMDFSVADYNLTTDNNYFYTINQVQDDGSYCLVQNSRIGDFADYIYISSIAGDSRVAGITNIDGQDTILVVNKE